MSSSSALEGGLACELGAEQPVSEHNSTSTEAGFCWSEPAVMSVSLLSE
jgi:hypothetical protein